MRCPQCNANIQKGTLFCGNCGFDVKNLSDSHNHLKYCSNCKEQVADDDVFCGNCGFDLKKKAAADIEQKIDDHLVQCNGCSNYVDKNIKYCGHCGNDIQAQEPTKLVSEPHPNPLQAEKKELEKERAEAERQKQLQIDEERAEAERQKQLQIEKERAEAERQRQLQIEKERAEAERQKQLQIEKERAEAERLKKLQLEKEIAHKTQVEKEKQNQLNQEIEKQHLNQKTADNIQTKKSGFSPSGTKSKLSKKPQTKTNEESLLEAENILASINKKPKFPKKILYIIGGSVIVLVMAWVFLFYLPTKNDNEMWLKVKNTNTINSYQQYLNKYPSGKYSGLAEEYKDLLVNDSINKVEERLAQQKAEEEAKRIEKRNLVIDKIYKKLSDYYKSISNKSFNADYYFTFNVDKYYSLSNTNTQKINEIYHASFINEFINPQFQINKSSIQFEKKLESYYVTYSSILYCYRKSKRKYQSSKSKLKIVYNDDFLITSIEEVSVAEVKFSNNPIEENNTSSITKNGIRTITGNKVNVRKGPGTNYDILYQVNTGDRVDVIGSKEISVNGEAILKSKVDYKSNGYSAYLNKGKAVKIISRSGNSVKISAKISSNKSVAIWVDESNLEINNSQKWLNISFNGRSGYVIDKFVNI